MRSARRLTGPQLVVNPGQDIPGCAKLLEAGAGVLVRGLAGRSRVPGRLRPALRGTGRIG